MRFLHVLGICNILALNKGTERHYTSVSVACLMAYNELMSRVCTRDITCRSLEAVTAMLQQQKCQRCILDDK